MKRLILRIVVLLGLAIGAGGGGWYWWQQQLNRLPEDIASGNGRIEGEEIHVATKFAGRVGKMLVEEGDMVADGQMLAQMDTAELDASLARAKAEVARAEQAVAEAKAQIVQRESEVRLARQELDRARVLSERGYTPRERLEQRISAHETAAAVLVAAKARLATAERTVDAAVAEARRIQTQLDDAVLKAPRAGRIQYRLANAGEVLAAGGKVATLLDLTDVTMTIFLPTTQAGRVFIGSPARIVLDAAPEFVIPAKVSFVASEAQFTPRTVETRSEREKLMFRVKVRIDPALLQAHIEKVRTGLPGVAYVQLGATAQWPERLAVKLPPERQR